MNQNIDSPDLGKETQQILRKIKKHNSNLGTWKKKPCQINMMVNFNIQTKQFCVRGPQFKQYKDSIPKITNLLIDKPKFPIYSKMFNSIYFLIGKKNQSIWNDFQNTYKQIFYEENPSIQITNISEANNFTNLRDFAKSGIQVRLLIEDIGFKNVDQFSQIIQSDQIIQIFVSSQVQLLVHNSRKKIQKVNMREEFEKNIKIFIMKSRKTKIHRNFVSLESNSSQAIRKKNMIQSAIEDKEKQYYLDMIQKFSKRMQNYQNKRLLNKMQLLRTSNKINKQSLMQNVENQIKMIQKEETEFLKKLYKWFDQKYPFQEIKNQKQKNEIYISIIQQYTEQHSIYEILNNNLRISYDENEQIIKQLTPYFKYLHQAIKSSFKGKILAKSLHEKPLYRAAILSKQQQSQLVEGIYIFNMGFLSSSKSQQMANRFHYRNKHQFPNSAYLIKIVINPLCKQFEYIEKQEGFLDITQQFIKNQRDDKMQQQQVLFNQMNIFKVIKIDKNKCFIQLQYAAHLSLIQKMKNGLLGVEERTKINTILTKIKTIQKKSYDKGLALVKQGKLAEAKALYQQMEEKGQITIIQKKNRLDALLKAKEYTYVKVLLQKQRQKKQYQIKNKQHQKLQKMQQKINHILLSAKQSELFRITSNFQLSLNRALEAEKTSKDMLQQVQNKIRQKKISNQQILKSIQTNIKSTVQFSKSKFETNCNLQSLRESISALIMLDSYYKFIQQKIFPKILINLTNLKKQNGLALSESLLKLTKLQINNKDFNKLIDIQALRKTIQDEKNILQSIFIKEQQIQNKNKYIEEYFTKRRGMIENWTAFYEAGLQIQSMQSNGTTVSFKKIKSELVLLRQTAQSLMDLEKNCYDIIISNLKILNMNVKPCLQSLKTTYYEKRFIKMFKLADLYPPLQQMRQIKSMQQINTLNIQRWNRYADFLVDYQLVVNTQSIGKSKKKGLQLIQKLQQFIQKQSAQNKVQLTHQKTSIRQAKLKYYKSLCFEKQIIQRGAAISSTKASTTNEDMRITKSIAEIQMQHKQQFKKIKQILREQETSYRSNTQINRTYYLLTNLNEQINAVLNSEVVSESYQKFISQVQEIRQKFEDFRTQRKKQLDHIQTEQQAQNYLYDAEAALRLGFYLQAQRKLHITKKIMKHIFGQSMLLYARQLPIKCYKLEAEIVGVYGNPEQKRKYLKRLKNLRQFVEEKVVNANVYAIVNQSYSFVALRYLPSQISGGSQNNQLNRIRQQAIQSLKKSINIRTGLGQRGQHVGASYSSLVQLKSKIKPLPEDIKQDHQKAQIIMDNLRQSMKIQPTYYLLQNKMQIAFERFLLAKKDDSSLKQIKQIQRKIKQNAQNYIKAAQEKKQKSLQIAEDLFQTGSFFSSKNQYREEQQKLLKLSENNIHQVLNLNSGEQDTDGNINIYLLQYRLSDSLYDFYKRIGNRTQKRKYKNLRQIISRKVTKQNSFKPPQSEKSFFQWFFKFCGT